MRLFNDVVDMHWEKDSSGLYHGRGYGIGEKYIYVGQYIHGEIWGDFLWFDTKTGDLLMKVGIICDMAHGKYEYYENNKLVERGIYQHGLKTFHLRLQHGKVYEYGFSLDDKLHGFGCTVDATGFRYTSPDWNNGIIDGLGCIQDANNKVLFYGNFVKGVPTKENLTKHSSMLKLWRLAHESDPCKTLAYACVESVLSN